MNTDTLYFKLDEFEIVCNESEGTVGVKTPTGVYDKSIISITGCYENLANTELTISLTHSKSKEVYGGLRITGYEKLERQTSNLDILVVYRNIPSATYSAICEYEGNPLMIDDLRYWFGIQHLIAIGYLDDFHGTIPSIVKCDEDLTLSDVWGRLPCYLGNEGKYGLKERVSMLSFFYVMVLMSRAALIPDFFLNNHCNLIEENKTKFNSLCKKYNDTVLKQSSLIKQYDVGCMSDYFYY